MTLPPVTALRLPPGPHRARRTLRCSGDPWGNLRWTGDGHDDQLFAREPDHAQPYLLAVGEVRRRHAVVLSPAPDNKARCHRPEHPERMSVLE